MKAMMNNNTNLNTALTYSYNGLFSFLCSDVWKIDGRDLCKEI